MLAALQGFDEVVSVDGFVSASTMCRLLSQLSRTGTDSEAEDIFRALGEHLPWKLEMHLETIYFARPGQALPRVATSR